MFQSSTPYTMLSTLTMCATYTKRSNCSHAILRLAGCHGRLPSQSPKFKDVDNLVNMLTYSMGWLRINARTPAYGDIRIMRYTPPTMEFEVMVITYHLQSRGGYHIATTTIPVPAIFIVIEGSPMLHIRRWSLPTHHHTCRTYHHDCAVAVSSTEIGDVVGQL